MEQCLPVALQRHLKDPDPYIYFARLEGNAPFSLIQFGVHRTPPLYGFGPGVRDHDLIHFVFSGCGDVTMGGRRFRVRQGEMFLIPAGEISYYQADEEYPWSYGWIGFDGLWGRAFLQQTGLSAAKPLADIPNLVGLHQKMLDMVPYMASAEGYLQLYAGVVSILSDCLSVQARPPMQEELRDSTTGHIQADERINQVITILERDFTQDISVQALADELHMSRTYLSAQFKNSTGCSIKTYITRLRMEYARSHMIQTTDSIRSIAATCGYHDPLFFSRVFKAHFGVPPTEYRDKLRNGEVQPALHD